MKKFILIAALIISFGASNGQLVTLENEENVITGTVSDTQLDVTGWEVVNASDQTIDFGCKRLGVQEAPGHTSQFCWGIICSPFGTGYSLSPEVVTLDPGGYSTSFYAHFKPNGQAGQSVLKYCWFDVNNTTNEFCYDVNYCIDAQCIVSVKEENPAGMINAISPNPMSGTGNISFSFESVPHSGKIVIYNAVGAVVKEVNLNKKNGIVILDSTEFENGIYFCAIENEGKVFATKRIVVAN